MQPQAVCNQIAGCYWNCSIYLLLFAPTSLTSHFLWSHWWSNRKLILFLWSRFLPNSITTWLQRVGSACLTKRSSRLMGRIGEVQPKSPCSALDLLHKTYSVWAKELDRATLLPQFSQSLHNSSSLHLLPSPTDYHVWERKYPREPDASQTPIPYPGIITFKRKYVSCSVQCSRKNKSSGFQCPTITAAANSTPPFGKRTPHN